MNVHLLSWPILQTDQKSFKGYCGLDVQEKKWVSDGREKEQGQEKV